MSSERLSEVFNTVHELLLEVGYERLTLDAVAARARTSKATLYRQWSGKPGLVMAALTHDGGGHPSLFADAGATSLDEAFAQLARTDLISDRDVRMGFMLLHAASTDPELGAALREQILTPRVEELAAVFHAAADRGEIVRDPPLFRRLAAVILTDLAFFPLINGHEASREDREALFRTIVRPALDRTDHDSPSPGAGSAA
ncbi:TetR/AcrR family transcriptional regulator [Promicromonospora sp. NPDC023987]|uniref:TetR/AcrR family transcriptional regulator n=1 Tax=Promicromonospora sp. NPDC023987 TaxID=3155360 RepID=UPI0033EE3826